MAVPRVRNAGGLRAVWYVLKKALQSPAGIFTFYRRLRARNACKTCALGMGGQSGGMVNEAGHFPEVCKKSVQAQAGDMQPGITENFFATTPVRALERFSPRELEELGRLTFPVMIREGEEHFRRISWEEALSTVAAAFRDTPPASTFIYSSGRASNEAAFLLQLVARAYGTPHIHNCSYYCHQASGVALNRVYGSGTASVELADLDRAGLVVLSGANPASNHPRLITKLVQLRRRGGKVIVINPLAELGLKRFRVPSDWRSFLFGSDVCDLYLQPHIGGDVALSKALLKGVLEARALDLDFISAHTSGWEAVEKDVLAVSWEALVEQSGVPRESIDTAVRMLAGAGRGIFAWAMGLTHHLNGVDNILALSNLALARGWLGKPGCGLLPIRGHSNVQGVGTVGVSPIVKEAFAVSLEKAFGITVPREPGMDTYSSMVAAFEGRVQAAMLLGGNLFASNPDRNWSAVALRRIPLTFCVTTKLNEGHVHGRGRTQIIVPCLARDEEPQSTTQESMFNFVRISDGGEDPPLGEARSEVEIIASLAEKILPPGRLDWAALRSHVHLREQMSATVPGLAPLYQADTERREFTIDGRIFHEPRFNTPDGKARFEVTPLPANPAGPGEFRVMTIRSEGQFNTVVYEEEDLYRGNRSRDVLMMSEADAASMGLTEGDPVTVTSETGSLNVRVAITGIRPGNLAMYYPEANVLVPRKLDPQSKTPAFKDVRVRITPAGGRKAA